MGRGRPRNEDVRRKVLSLFDQEVRPSLEDIGKAVGLSRQRVSQILIELGKDPTDSSSTGVSAVIKEICELGGISKSELAAILDVAPSQISQWTHRADAKSGNARRLGFLLKALKNAADESRR